MNSVVNSIVTEIRELAPKAGEISESLASAIDSERSAETEVLLAAIEAAKPGIRAICGRVEVAHELRWIDNVSTAEETTTSNWRGVRLAGDRSPKRDYPNADCGEYEGSALYLRSDGAFVELRYSGRWSKWQGAPQSWHATVQSVAGREAMDTWDLEECLTTLRDRLRSVLAGTAPERAKAARERAERLASVVTLLK